MIFLYIGINVLKAKYDSAYKDLVAVLNDNIYCQLSSLVEGQEGLCSKFIIVSGISDIIKLLKDYSEIYFDNVIVCDADTIEDDNRINKVLKHSGKLYILYPMVSEDEDNVMNSLKSHSVNYQFNKILVNSNSD